VAPWSPRRRILPRPFGLLEVESPGSPRTSGGRTRRRRIIERKPRAGGIVRRQTLQRRVIRETVRSSRIHPTAEHVYDQVRRRLPRISLGTVYRNLQLLVSEGELQVWSRGGRARFDGDLSDHDHFVCEACGLLLDLERPATALSTEKRLRARGHEVNDRVLDFIGLCRDCRRSRKQGPRRDGGLRARGRP
jgi:Fe2+ or Zn2+ uptake regulation protein